MVGFPSSYDLWVSRPPRRPPRKITQRYLERSALHYLDRYTAPSPHLRRVLQRRIDKSLAHHGGDPAEAAAMLDAAVERLQAGGALDDVRWANAKDVAAAGG